MADNIDLRQELLESYESQFDEQMSTWAELEKKSQASLTASGVLLSLLGATINSFFSNHKVEFSCGQQLNIIFTLLFLLGAAIFSYRALRTKEYPPPPFGSHVRQEFIDIQSNGKERDLKTRRENMYNTLNEHWEKTVTRVAQILKEKSVDLDHSFHCLLISLLLTAIQIWNRI